MKSQDVTVVGAGMAGLSAALLAARAGKKTRIFEQSAQIGGFAARHVFRGVSCDMGSHRLHTESLDVPLIREMQNPCRFVTRPRRGVILLGGRFIRYPPSPAGLMSGLGATRSLDFALSLSRRKRPWDRERLALDDRDVGFEHFVRARVGEAAYEAFYRPYAEKVWGIPPGELSQTVAKSRLSTASPLTALTSLFARRRQEFLYPEEGIGKIVDYLLAQLHRLGVSVQLETPYTRERHGGDRVLHSGAFGTDIHEFVHRGLYLVYVAVPVDRLRDFETYYTPESRFWFGRVAEIQNYSPRLARAGESVLVVEIPEGRFGEAERFHEGPRWQALLEQLREARILPPRLEPIDVEQRFLRNVYPVYRRGWVDRWKRALREKAEAGFYPFGRQGLFLHCNLHHCARMATDVVEHVVSGGDAESWARHASEYLGQRTLD